MTSNEFEIWWRETGQHLDRRYEIARRAFAAALAVQKQEAVRIASEMFADDKWAGAYRVAGDNIGAALMTQLEPKPAAPAKGE